MLNEGLKIIAENAFRSCTSLESIRLPSTITEVDEDTFYQCNNLRVVILKEGLKKISHGAFENCNTLESISLPSTVTEINDGIFEGCSSLREVSPGFTQ